MPALRRSWLFALLALSLVAAPAAAAVDDVTTYSTITGAGIFGQKFDPAGNLYVAGTLSGVGKVWKIAPGGAPVTEFATGIPDPRGVALDSGGNVFVSDWGNLSNPTRIWKITPGGVKSTFVSGTPGPTFLAMGAGDVLYVGTWGSRKVQKITPAGVVSDYTGLIGASIDEISGLAYDAATGDLYAGSGPNIVRIAPGGSPVTPVAGGLIGIYGLVRNDDGSFFAARYSHRDVFKITADGAISTFAGVHLDAGCVDGPRLSATFMQPAGLALHDGVLHIADFGCHKVRTIELTGPTPAMPTSWGRVKTQYR